MSVMDVGVLHHVIAGDVEVCDVSNVEWGQRSCNKDITDIKSNKKTQEEAPETIKKNKKNPSCRGKYHYVYMFHPLLFDCLSTSH